MSIDAIVPAGLRRQFATMRLVSSSLYAAEYASAFFTIQSAGEFPHHAFYCHTSPLVTANAPPVFCPFQLWSVTDEQHVRIV